MRGNIVYQQVVGQGRVRIRAAMLGAKIDGVAAVAFSLSKRQVEFN
jgi:hypothetical protein